MTVVSNQPPAINGWKVGNTLSVVPAPGGPPITSYKWLRNGAQVVTPAGDATNTGYSASVAELKKPARFHRNMHAAYRTASGTGAVWAWT